MTDVKQCLEAFLDTMAKMSDVIEAENKALAEHRPDRIAELVDRKLLLGRTFERQMQQLVGLRQQLSALPAAEKQALAERSERFARLTAQNQTALEAAKRATERLVTHIVDAVRKMTNPQPVTYGRPYSMRPRSTAPTNRVCLSINQTF